ncbi:nuclear transport factor 2 family protein [Pleurocapsales cyanobacterium LEGE 06147]|nr:nuclear transport factor 2 family protein [Pleurocapsales cyanobacterium LEGE 06147]
MRSNPLALAVLLGASLLPVSLGNFTGNAQEQVLVTSNQLSLTEESQDEQVIHQLIQEWLVGFSPKEQTVKFSFRERLAKFYNSTPGRVTLHDNADSQMRIVNSAADYGEIWDNIFPTLQFLDNKLTQVYQIEIKGDLALTVFSFDSTFIFPDGKKDVVPTLATLAWKRTPDGWKIIHEHGSALKAAQS